MRAESDRIRLMQPISFDYLQDFFQLKVGPNISLEPKRKVLPCTVDAPTPMDFNITSLDSGSSLATRSTTASMCLMVFIVMIVAMLMEIEINC